MLRLGVLFQESDALGRSNGAQGLRCFVPDLTKNTQSSNDMIYGMLRVPRPLITRHGHVTGRTGQCAPTHHFMLGRVFDRGTEGRHRRFVLRKEGSVRTSDPVL